MPVGVGIQFVQRARYRRDVSKNALKELPECVCNMGNLTSLYAPPEAWMSWWPRREHCCRRNAEYNKLQALPRLESCRPGGTDTLLYVCVPPLRSTSTVDRRCHRAEAMVCGRLVGHNRLKALPLLPRTLQRLCALRRL
jgi:hypothetical protein